MALHQLDLCATGNVISEYSSDDDLESSKLGKHEYWQESYAKELKNFKEIDDVGEIWFGTEVFDTMVEWTVEHVKQMPTSLNSKILDLGTGNGVFPIKLTEMGFVNVYGSDYSASSINLCKTIAGKRNVSNITWIEDDLLDTKITTKFDVITDKGTFDAIGLSVPALPNKIKYKHSVWNLLDSNGYLIITSCNNTADEIKEMFCTDYLEKLAGSEIDSIISDPSLLKNHFKFVDLVKTYPKFKFGGVEGSKVCTVMMQKA